MSSERFTKAAAAAAAGGGGGLLEESLRLPRQGRSLCLLVVADMDLPSASLLAEAALRELPKGGTLVDGILACGPFVTPQSLEPYLPNQQIPSSLTWLSSRSHLKNEHQQPQQNHHHHHHHHLSLELTHALEGLVTGCLSQLESIACRVAWIPSTLHDPRTLFVLDRSRSSNWEEKRLTPNARNIHRQTLPLAPGLSCCGLAVPNSQHETIDETKEIISKLLDISQRNNEAMEPPVPIVPVSIVVTTSCHDNNNNNTDTTASTAVFADENRIILHIDAIISSDTGSNDDDDDDSYHCHHHLHHNPVPRLEGTVLYPGSLRERGEYCLVQFQVVPDDNNTKGRTTSSSHDMFHWEVTSVDFRRMGDAATSVVR